VSGVKERLAHLFREAALVGDGYETQLTERALAIVGVSTCTCDDNCDDRCPRHHRENQLQDEIIQLRAELAEVREEGVSEVFTMLNDLFEEHGGYRFIGGDGNCFACHALPGELCTDDCRWAAINKLARGF
jgi:hypothetical protein